MSKTAVSRAFGAAAIPSGMVRRRALPPDPSTPHFTGSGTGFPRRVRLDHFHQRRRDLTAVLLGVGGIGETGERVLLVPQGIGHFHMGVIDARRGGVFVGTEGEAGAAEGVALLERALRMALRPEDLPARRAFGPGRGHEFFYVAPHIFEIQRKGHYAPAIAAFRRTDREELDLRHFLQSVDNDLGIAPPRREIPVLDAVEFGQSDGRLHLGHPVVPADHVVDVRQLLLEFEQAQTLHHIVPVVPEAARAPGDVFVVRSNHAAFATRRERLVLAEAAPRDVADRAGLLSFVFAAVCLGVVVDHEQVVLLRQRPNLVHIADVAVKVDGHDGFGAAGDQFFRALDAHAMVVQVYVREAWDGSRLHHREAGGDERIAGHDHFIARPYAERGEPDVERRRPRCHADGELGALPLGKSLLELHTTLAGPVVHLAGAEHGFHFLNRLLAELRPWGQFGLYCLLAAVDRQCFVHVRVLSSAGGLRRLWLTSLTCQRVDLIHYRRYFRDLIGIVGIVAVLR